MKKKHLYNTKLGKVPWFIERFGAREIFLKPLRTVFAPVIIPVLPRKRFRFQGAELNCFYHGYNMTWATERCVEVPIARHFLSRVLAENVLEVGNVLSHYGPVHHVVLDKFEKGRGVINQDITAFQPARRFELILSISTFEHIGFDDESEGGSAPKIRAAIEACRALLEPGGKLVITVPIGYNPELDAALRTGELGGTETFLKKFGPQEWRECAKNEALACKFKEPFPYANAIVVIEFGARA